MHFLVAPSERLCTDHLGQSGCPPGLGRPSLGARGLLSSHPRGASSWPQRFLSVSKVVTVFLGSMCLPGQVLVMMKPQATCTLSSVGPPAPEASNAQGICWNQPRPSLGVGLGFSHVLIQAPVSRPLLPWSVLTCATSQGERQCSIAGLAQSSSSLQFILFGLLVKGRAGHPQSLDVTEQAIGSHGRV